MELLPENLRARLPPLRALDDVDEPRVLIRYSLPCAEHDWYAVAGDAHEDDFVFFGFVRHERRFRYFRLSELEVIRGPSGETVVWDQTFTGGGLTDVVPAPDL